MPLFNVEVDAEGNEVRTPVDLNTVDLPETHPVKKALAQRNAEAKRRREQLEALQESVNSDEDAGAENEGGSDVPASKKPAAQGSQQPIDLDAIAAKAAEEAEARIEAKRAAAAQATAERTAAIDTIVTETGLNKDLRSVIESIPDLPTARRMAETLAKRELAFDQAPSGGGGARDTTHILERAEARLNLPKDTEKQDKGGY